MGSSSENIPHLTLRPLPEPILSHLDAPLKSEKQGIYSDRELFKRASGKSRREVEATRGRLNPRKMLLERITPVTIEEPVAEQSDQTDQTEPGRLPTLVEPPDP